MSDRRKMQNGHGSVSPHDIEGVACLLRGLHDDDPPQGIVASVLNGLEPKRPSLWKRWFARPAEGRRTGLRLAVAMAGMAVVFVCGVFVGQQNVGQEATVPIAALEVLADPELDGPDASFFIGRGLLMAERAELAIPHLERASRLAPRISEYHYWLGLAYASVADAEKEQQSYRRALATDPDFLQAHLNLGHSLMDSGDWSGAMEQYRRVLAIDPGHDNALYASGLAAGMMGNKDEEIEAWKRYLARDRTGKWAVRAVRHLNDAGDFSFRAHQLGLQRVVLPNFRFQTPAPTEMEIQALTELSQALKRSPDMTLHVIVHVAGDMQTARGRALVLKQAVLSMGNRVDPDRIRASWFDSPETVVGSSGTIALDESVRFIGQLEKAIQHLEGRV